MTKHVLAKAGINQVAVIPAKLVLDSDRGAGIQKSGPAKDLPLFIENIRFMQVK